MDSSAAFTWQSRRELERLVVGALVMRDFFPTGDVRSPLNKLVKYRRALVQCRANAGTDQDGHSPIATQALRQILEDAIDRRFGVHPGIALRMWLGLPCDEIPHTRMFVDWNNDAMEETVTPRVSWPNNEPDKDAIGYNKTLAADYYLSGERPRASYIIRKEFLPEIASTLCEGMPDEGRAIPDIKELEESLERVLHNGLPLKPTVNDSSLLAFLPFARETAGKIARVAQMDAFLREQLDEFEIDEYRQAARILFAHAPGTKGASLKVRQEEAATVLERSWHHVRTEIRPKIVSALAWQIYRVKLADE